MKAILNCLNVPTLRVCPAYAFYHDVGTRDDLLNPYVYPVLSSSHDAHHHDDPFLSSHASHLSSHDDLIPDA